MTGAKWKSGETKIPHYIDFGYLSKGNSVCRYYGIKKNVIESAALKAIRDTLIEGNVVSLFQTKVIEKGKNKLNEMALDEPDLIKKQKDLQIKIDNLLQAVESGINVETVPPKVRELEKEKQKTTSELARIKRSKMQDDSSIRDVASQV